MLYNEEKFINEFDLFFKLYKFVCLVKWEKEGEFAFLDHNN